MKFLRFIAVMLSWLCFATAGYASVAMPCCDEEVQVQDIKPCHEQNSTKAPVKDDHKPMSAKPCSCLGNMQQSVASEPLLLQPATLDAEQRTMASLAISHISYSIYHPPRAVS